VSCSTLVLGHKTLVSLFKAKISTLFTAVKQSTITSPWKFPRRKGLSW